MPNSLHSVPRMLAGTAWRRWHGVASPKPPPRSTAVTSCTAARRAGTHADAAAMPWLVADAEKLEAIGLMEGGEPIDAAIQRLEVLFPAGSPEQLVVARHGVHDGMLLATQGHLHRGLRLLEQGVQIQSELGRTSPGDAAWFRGHGYFWAGRPADAVPFLVEAATSAIQTGDRSHGSTQAALAAHVLAQVGEYDEVERLVGLAKDSSSPDDRTTQMLWRGALARFHVASGANADAERLLRDAVELAEGTDSAAPAGLALIDLAWVSLRIGNPKQAGDAARRAVGILDRRGAIPCATSRKPSLRRQNSRRNLNLSDF